MPLASSPKYNEFKDLKFKPPSGKIEIIPKKLEKQGLPLLLSYTSPAYPLEGQFRLKFDKFTLYTQ